MIFLKALVFACIICVLGSFISSLLWKRFTFAFSEILPFLLAFLSLVTFLFIRILPFHPIWLIIPIVTQVFLTAFVSALGTMKENFALEVQRKTEKLGSASLHSTEKSDGEVSKRVCFGYNNKENSAYRGTFSHKRWQIEDFLSKKFKRSHLQDKNLENNIPATIDIKADIGDNISSILENSYGEVARFRMQDENEKNIEILFLQADIFLVQGDIEKNKQLLFYINNKYRDTSIGNRAHKELIKLYGKEIFLKER